MMKIKVTFLQNCIFLPFFLFFQCIGAMFMKGVQNYEISLCFAQIQVSLIFKNQFIVFTIIVVPDPAFDKNTRIFKCENEFSNNFTEPDGNLFSLFFQFRELPLQGHAQA
jgi:hypothetical protein